MVSNNYKNTNKVPRVLLTDPTIYFKEKASIQGLQWSFQQLQKGLIKSNDWGLMQLRKKEKGPWLPDVSLKVFIIIPDFEGVSNRPQNVSADTAERKIIKEMK